MRNNHASVARRAHRAQRPRPTQLVAPKLHEASFWACVLDDPARNCDAHSDPADGFADRVVVREVLEKREQLCPVDFPIGDLLGTAARFGLDEKRAFASELFLDEDLAWRADPALNPGNRDPRRWSL